MVDVPRTMWVPIAVLATFVCLGGALGFSVDKPTALATYLQSEQIVVMAQQLNQGFHLSTQSLQSVAASLLGIGACIWVYGYRKKGVEKSLSPLRDGFYIDQIYDRFVIHPVYLLADFVGNFFEKWLWVVIIYSPAQVIMGVAGILQTLQNGQVRFYVAWMLTGASFLIYFMTKAPHV